MKIFAIDISGSMRALDEQCQRPIAIGFGRRRRLGRHVERADVINLLADDLQWHLAGHEQA